MDNTESPVCSIIVLIIFSRGCVRCSYAGARPPRLIRLHAVSSVRRLATLSHASPVGVAVSSRICLPWYTP